MKQSNFFAQPEPVQPSLPLGEQLKRDGMAKAAENRKGVLELARGIAIGFALSRPTKTCCADDVIEALIIRGHRPEELGNAAGSIFKRDTWTFTGEWKPSRRPSNHARFVRVWQLSQRKEE